jgi:hypothetical protein
MIEAELLKDSYRRGTPCLLARCFLCWSTVLIELPFDVLLIRTFEKIIEILFFLCVCVWEFSRITGKKSYVCLPLTFHINIRTISFLCLKLSRTFQCSNKHGTCIFLIPKLLFSILRYIFHSSRNRVFWQTFRTFVVSFSTSTVTSLFNYHHREKSSHHIWKAVLRFGKLQTNR